MLISSKEIKTISTINIKLQLSHQTAEGSQPRQVLGINHYSASGTQVTVNWCLTELPPYTAPCMYQ